MEEWKWLSRLTDDGVPLQQAGPGGNETNRGYKKRALEFFTLLHLPVCLYSM